MSSSKDNKDGLSSSSDKIEYNSETELLTEFYKCMRDPNNLETATNYLYNSLLDETILGIAFELHHSMKTGLLDAIEGEPEDEKTYSLVDIPGTDVFGSCISKITNLIQYCTCPICERSVSALKFASHLEKCMGLGRNSSRLASRRIARSSDGNNYFPTTPVSDDEDDADWSGEKRKKTNQKNGTKKNGKSSS